MALSPAYVVLVDISGYTKFVKLHRTSVIRAEWVVT